MKIQENDIALRERVGSALALLLARLGGSTVVLVFHVVCFHVSNSNVPVY